MDSVTSDLGYITNSGISRKQKNHDPDLDDIFRVEVGIQMADMDLTNTNDKHKIYFAVKFGEIIVVGKSNQTKRRPSQQPVNICPSPLQSIRR